MVLSLLFKKSNPYQQMINRLTEACYFLENEVKSDKRLSGDYLATSISDPSLFNIIGVRTVDDVIRRRPSKVTITDRYSGQSATFRLVH